MDDLPTEVQAVQAARLRVTAPEPALGDAERLSRLLLPRVSRTFALGIKLLPPKLEPPVRVGYLLCRIADTIEDDLASTPERKAALLDAFLECFDSAAAADDFGSCIAELSANDDYLALVAQTGHVFLTYRMLDAPTRDILRRWIGEMVGGMRRFVVEHRAGIRIASLDEFREYCFFVAGTVGHLLTELWYRHSVVVGRVRTRVCCSTVRRSAKRSKR